MTDYNWANLRQHATQLFNGETPRPHLEQEIIDVFTEQPQLVAAAIEQIGAQFAGGKVRSGWAVLRTHIVNAAAPQSNATVTDTKNREKRIAQAQQWIRAAGIHFDRAAEIEDELFGDRGILREWHQAEGREGRPQDQALRDRMLELWADQRHIGVRLEREQIVRLGRRRIIAARAARIAKRYPTSDVDLNEHQAAQTNAELITETLPDDLPAELQPQETT